MHCSALGNLEKSPNSPKIVAKLIGPIPGIDKDGGSNSKTIDLEYQEIKKCLNKTDYNILLDVSGNNIEYVKSQLEKLDDNIMDYMHYWFEKYYRNGFCDAVELISGCLR